MKRVILVLFLVFGLVFTAGFFSPQNVNAACSCNAGIAKLFAEPTFSRTVRNYVPGDTIYVRLEIESNGEDMKLVRVINQNNEEVKRAIFACEGNGPYTYTASMLVPTEPGTYYLDIQIKGPNGVFASQENFNVGNPSGSTNNVVVSAHAEAVSGGGNSQALAKANSVVDNTSVQNNANTQVLPTEVSLQAPSLTATTSTRAQLSFWQRARLMMNQFLIKLQALF